MKLYVKCIRGSQGDTWRTTLIKGKVYEAYCISKRFDGGDNLWTQVVVVEGNEEFIASWFSERFVQVGCPCGISMCITHVRSSP